MVIARLIILTTFRASSTLVMRMLVSMLLTLRSEPTLTYIDQRPGRVAQVLGSVETTADDSQMTMLG